MPANPLPPVALWAALAVMAVVALAAALLWWMQRRHGRRLAAALQLAQARLGDAEAGTLPGVMPRTRFGRALDDAVQRTDLNLAPLALLFVNLDNFAQLNETFGYAVGDKLLAQVAERLVQQAGSEVGIARMGGDEFALLAPCQLTGARQLAAGLLTVLGKPYGAGDRREVLLSASIGVAAYPGHGSKARLLGHAATAMRQVKRAGGGDYMVFEPRMAVDVREQAELLHDLRLAVTHGQLELYYQPKVDAASLQVTAAEALLRWHHPRHGLISPAVFIPLAERHGLIASIGNWVIEDACRQAAAWRDAGLRMRVAINISAYQMRQDDLAQRIVGALERHRLQPNRFTCEITESVAMEDTRITQRTFAQLGAAGLHVSIDDFGVGQASLSYLRRLPAAELKIDASFVQDLESSADARSIVDAVVRLAHALDLRVVAEGVETEAQSDCLVKMGCDELQGYYFARPMPAAALSLWAMKDDGPRQQPEFRDSLFQDTRSLEG